MKHLSTKVILAYFPELLLFIGIVVCFAMDLMNTGNVNYFMIFAAMILTGIVVSKNKYFVLSISILLGLLSVYMMLALLSEYHEFPAMDPRSIQMLTVGSLLFGSLLVISFYLPKKYL